MSFFLRACSKYFFFAGFFSLFINTLYLTFPLYMLAVYVRVLDSFSFPTLYFITLMAISALVVFGILEFLRSRLLVRVGIRLDRLLSRIVLKNMLQDLGRVESIHYRTGLKDINTLRNYLGGSSIFSFFDVPWIFIYLGVIYLVHPVLGITATVGGIIIFVIGLLQSLLTKKNTVLADESSNESRQWVSTSFRTARELQTMGMIENVVDQYCLINDEELKLQHKINRVNHILGAVSQSFSVLMQVIIFGTGAFLVLGNEANPGVIIAASIIMGRALAPINQGISAWKQTSGAKIAYTNLNRLLKLSENKRSISVEQVKGHLSVKDADLKIGEVPILTGINFELNPGEILGVVGPNGVGKTSICRMLLGMWAPSRGEVKLDGQNICELDNEVLGSYFGYLPQKIELFSGTVSENIARMGVISDEKVIKAAEKAGAHEMILSFPQGYDTDIGEAGQSLSGGQRQRLGLSRSLYGDPRVVILDEPDSSLDKAGDQSLMNALFQLKKEGVTTIMITHKPGLLSVVDKILMLENGEQAGFGNRDGIFGQMMGDVNAKYD